jgi:hypothetical protein
MEQQKTKIRAWNIPIEELQNFDFKPVQQRIVAAAIQKIHPVIDYLVGEKWSSQPTFVEVAALMALMNQLAIGASSYSNPDVMDKILEAQVALQSYIDFYYPGNPPQYTALPARTEIPHLGVNTLCEMRQLLY